MMTDYFTSLINTDGSSSDGVVCCENAVMCLALIQHSTIQLSVEVYIQSVSYFYLFVNLLFIFVNSIHQASRILITT